MGFGIGRFCPGKMGFKPHWYWDLVTGNGKKMLKIKKEKKKKKGMGFENCDVGFGKKLKWELGLVSPSPFPSLQDPLLC